DAEAERGGPEARGAFEIPVALVIVDVDALRLVDDGRAGLQVLLQVGLRMHDARDVARVQAVGAKVHCGLLVVFVPSVELVWRSRRAVALAVSRDSRAWGRRTIFPKKSGDSINASASPRRESGKVRISGSEQRRSATSIMPRRMSSRL